MDRLIIIGAGPHAKVVADILKQNNEYEIAGLIDAERKPGFLGLNVIGNDDSLAGLYADGIKKAIVAVGNNIIRKRLFEKAVDTGFEMVNAVSGSAVISPGVFMGKGIAVMPGAVINVDTVLGDGCIINTNASVDHDGRIGEFVHIAPGSVLAGNVQIGKLSFCGCGCRVIDGIKVGQNVIIGAGAVVISSAESEGTVVGIPARYIKRKEENK